MVKTRGLRAVVKNRQDTLKRVFLGQFQTPHW
jgi:hypothetical protein